ncbi:hypothetical protein [Moraxella ovis]|uniref:hypothetical protein n=1 Tax=Moraxella ovis TaxID=29433 RepID=UPI000D96A359|nr:hypothetical protein [Moraxella ovis]SPX86974.1 Uncharacterised protein [Moraxella ovis]STZ06148.1 Uncharacterised protein [Moraxella ovis]
MKKLSILALSATVATAPAFAETTVYQAVPSTTPSVELSTQPTQATDLSFAFDDTQNLQAVAMTDSQMQETEGAWIPNAIGGLAGMYGAGYGYLAGGGDNPYKFIGAAALGGALGFASPVNGVRSGLTTFGTGFASTYVPTKFGGKYW